MAKTRYTFDKNSVSYGALRLEIEAGGLPIDLDSPFRDSLNQSPAENLSIGFTTALDAGQQATLAATVAAHDSSAVLAEGRRVGFSYRSESKLRLTETWKSFASFIWGGSDYFGSHPKSVYIAAARTSGDDTYSIRLYDVESKLVLCTITGLSNDQPSAMSMGAPANFSNGRSLIEIQAKREAAGSSCKISIEATEVLF